MGKIKIIGILVMVMFMFSNVTVSAASLTNGQINAILGLLDAFDVDFDTREAVYMSLVGPKENYQVFNDINYNFDHYRGSKNAEVTIIEYSDYECPYCSRFHQTMKEIMKNYNDDEVAWVYRHFPINGHSMAREAARASECVADIEGENAFWEFSDKIFMSDSSDDYYSYGSNLSLSTAKLKELALSVGTDEREYEICTQKMLTENRVARDYDDGLKIAKTSPRFGTPYNLLISKDGEVHEMAGAQPYATVKAKIDLLLK